MSISDGGPEVAASEHRYRCGFADAGWVAQPIKSVAISASVKVPPRRQCRAWLRPSGGILGSREKRLARQSIDRTFTLVMRKRRPRQVLLDRKSTRLNSSH